MRYGWLDESGEDVSGGVGISEYACLDTRVVLPYNWWLSLNARRLWRMRGMPYEIPVRRVSSPAVRERWRVTRSPDMVRGAVAGDGQNIGTMLFDN
jgi:hypothetical protein